MENSFYSVVHPDQDQLMQMRELWQITFGDSIEYIDMIFSNYVDPQYCLCAICDKKVISMLIGIPYEFKIDNSCKTGLYLCGLATVNSYRGQGIMRILIENIEDVCRKFSILFTFLIPADAYLRRYYMKFGYTNSALIKRYFITNGIDIFKLINRNNVALRDGCKFLSFEEFTTGIFEILNNTSPQLVFLSSTNYQSLNDKLCTSICKICYDFEMHLKYDHIIHTYKDWRLIIEDKLSERGLLIADLAKSIVVIIDADLQIFILAGDEREALKLIRDLFQNKPTSDVTTEDAFNFGDGFGNEEISIDVREELYGQIKFLNEKSEEILKKSQGSENRIFQGNRLTPQKFRKMNFHEKSDYFQPPLPSSIHFRLMLD